MFMAQYLLLKIREKKKTQSTSYLYKQWLCNENVLKFINVTLNSIQHKVKSVAKQKTSFPKESIENADFYKLVLNKIMITHE